MNKKECALHDYLGLHDFTIPLHVGSTYGMVCECGKVRFGDTVQKDGVGFVTADEYRHEVYKRLGRTLVMRINARYKWTFIDYKVTETTHEKDIQVQNRP